MKLKRTLALLLAAVLLLGCLSGCKKSESTGDPTAPGSSSSQTSSGSKSPTEAEYAYQAEYYSFPDNLHYVQAVELLDNTVYFVASIEDGEKTETSRWFDENGEEHTDEYSYTVYRNALLTMDLDTLASQEMENFHLPEVPEGWNGSSYINQIHVVEDGSIWVAVSLNTYRYNTPEGVEMGDEEYWNYYEEGINAGMLVHLSKDGTEIGRIELGEGVSISSFIFTDDGTIYASDYENVYVLDKDGNLQFTLDGLDYNEISKFSGNEVGVIGWEYNEMTKESGYFFKTIDVAAKTWGQKKDIPVAAWRVFPGDEVYDFYYVSNNNIFGYKDATKTQTKVVDWMECDVNSNNIGNYSILPDGRVYAVYNDWNGESTDSQLVVLTRVDRSTIQEKTVLKLACFYLDWDLRSKIVEFNKTSSTHRIIVQDYSEVSEDTAVALQKLNTEILAGNVPDIFLTSNLPMSQYAAKGLLVDLYPFIDADSRFTRDSFVQPVMKALETDGKLYEMPNTFSVQTAVGLEKVVGGYDKWNLAALKDAYSMLPDGATIFANYYTRDNILQTCVSNNISYFVDWETGKCSFDSDDFVALLEFANSFPAEMPEMDEGIYEPEYLRLNRGEQLLTTTYLSSFNDLVYQIYGLDGGFRFVGYPSESGTTSNSFRVSGGFAISSTCADPQVLWDFFSSTLTEEYQDPDSYNIWSFPINQNSFDKSMKKVMEYNYATDENGEKYLDENGEPVINSIGSYGGYGQEYPEDYAVYDENGELVEKVAEWDRTYVEVYKVRKEVIQTILDLIDSTTSVFSYDDSIMAIINEEWAAYVAGAQTAQATADMIQSRVSLYVVEQK